MKQIGSLICLSIFTVCCIRTNDNQKKMEDNFELQVNHISTMLVVKDIDSSVNFYKNIFGFKVIRYEKHIIALVELNNIQLYFIPYSQATDDKPGVELKTLDEKE